MKNRLNVIPAFLGSMLSYPTSWLHLEDEEFVDRMQTLTTNQITSNSNNNHNHNHNHNHKRHNDLSRGSVRHKGWPTSTLLRLATKAMESLATHSSSPTYHQGNRLEDSTKSQRAIQTSRCSTTVDWELSGDR
jgi:hypothetical protein